MRWSCAFLAWVACNSGKGDDGAVPDEADADADADADSDADTDTDPTGPALTERPANPTCLAPARPVTDAEVAVQAAYPNLTFGAAVQALQPPDDPDTWWVVLQEGRIVRFDDDPAASTTTEVLDITGPVNDNGNELGLLSIAFHPDWANNRDVIVSYTASGPTSILARYHSNDGGLTLDPASEEVLLRVSQPFTNHNGGLVAFSPEDGMLYAGFGDGGSAGDPLGAGQDLSTLLGKVIRIDVDGGSPYAIPPDNPFVSDASALPEIWALGFRNPWRWSFDPPTGDLWLADVGQYEIEEVDVVEKGGNYGWNVMEGDACYSPSVGCDPTGLVLPVATTLHDEGDFCVTGGVVYRGTAIPDLVGTYVWGDYGSGRLYALLTDPYTGAQTRSLLIDAGLSMTSIQTDADGEIVIVDRYRGLYRVVPAGTPAPDTFPQTLAETGCFDAAGAPLPMMIPVEVAHPFWSDSADKQRWLAIPDGTTISTDDRGKLDFPIGTVLAKEFHLGGKKVETRLFVRHDDGGWAGYAYAWDEAQSATTLLASSAAATGGGGEPWTIPSRSECLQCHNAAAVGPLAHTTTQLDLDAAQSNGWVENQVDLLVRLGMLDPPSVRPGAFPAVDDTSADLTERARAYLDVNCSFCHQPGGSGGGDLDLRWDTALAATGLCGDPTRGDLGIPGARIVAPGDPASSVLSSRVRRRDAYAMPPLASDVVDAVGAQLLDDWISSLASCP